ncbi:hypothetical protein C8Q70DRAFT_71608 [Cubamyces menziesii]|nr:hypothetical protein C8Q70DRAFT_71608 [Cubamyces menziesii]
MRCLTEVSDSGWSCSAVLSSGGHIVCACLFQVLLPSTLSASPTTFTSPPLPSRRCHLQFVLALLGSRLRSGLNVLSFHIQSLYASCPFS